MLKKTVKIISILFFAMTFALGQISPASALEAGDIVIQVKPADQEIDLAPGQVVRGMITVQNVGRLPFTFNVSAKPYQIANESYDPDFVTENSYTKLHNWITFSKNSFQLEPGASQNVIFTITVPDDVPGGGQYAAIIAETRDSMSEDANVRIISQLASLIYAHVEGEEHIGGVLLDHSLPTLLLGSPFTARATVKNDGNIDFRLTHKLNIRDFFTNREVLTETSVDENGKFLANSTPMILPETQRSNSITWDGAPQLGVFKVTQTISFLDQTYTFDQVVILCPIWLAGAAAFFILLIILWVILRLHSRKRRRPQVF